MANLPYDFAKSLAAALTTVGHPYFKEAIEATALLLVRLCKGALINGRQWTPEEQAQTMVDEIVSTWEWPERGGTKALQNLFYSKYAGLPVAAPAVSPEEALQRRLLAPRCEYCEPDEEFCHYGGPKAHAREKEVIEAFASTSVARLPLVAKPAQLPPDYSSMRDRAQETYEDERRRTQQLDLLAESTPRAEGDTVIPFSRIDEQFRESQRLTRMKVEDAERTLKDPDATGEQKDIARLTIEMYGDKPEKKRKRR